MQWIRADHFMCGGGNGAVEEFVFRSNAINMGGNPPPQGWVFTYDGCCRNAAISNMVISPNATGFTLRAIMYPYNGTNTSPCFDSSPVFTQRPATIICAGNPFTYNHNAYDPDKDSLVYSFAAPLDWLDGADFTSTSPPALFFSLLIPLIRHFQVQAKTTVRLLPSTVKPVKSPFNPTILEISSPWSRSVLFAAAS